MSATTNSTLRHKTFASTKDEVQENRPTSQTIELLDLTITITPSRRKTIKMARLSIQGKLTIKDVEQFIKVIQPVLNEYEKVSISLEEISTIDLSFLQALYHIKNSDKTCETNISATFPIQLKKNISNAGFNNFFFQRKHA